MVSFREERMGGFCGTSQNALRQLAWASILLAKGWSLLTCLIYILRFEKQRLIPGLFFQPSLTSWPAPGIQPLLNASL